MAKNYFNRYVWLIDTIRRHGHISFADISRQWQQSPLNEVGSPLAERTFHHHREAIADSFGIEIKCDRSLGYYIANSVDLEGDTMKEWLLESLSLNNLLNESGELRERILFEKIPSAQKWLPAIIDAMRDGKALRMTYQGFGWDAAETVDTHPYCLKLFKQRWYMLSKTEGKKRPRIYALDRIQELEVLQKELQLPEGFSGEDFFSDYFGIIVDNDQEPSTVDIRVAADQVKFVESLPMHASQMLIESNPESSIFRYRLVPTYDFKQEILRHGAAFEVLSPEWFRDEIKEEIAAMAKHYRLGQS